MAMMFRVEVRLGNDAMQSGADVADALRDLASVIEDDGDASGVYQRMFDVNGNRVGTAWAEDTAGDS